MNIVQKNPELLILDEIQLGVGSSSIDGMVSGTRLLLKGKNALGQIKRFELEFASYAEVEELQNTLSQIRPFASEVNDLARAIGKSV